MRADRTYTSFYEAMDTMIKNCPEKKRFVMYVTSFVYNFVRTLSGAYFRGRWLYIDYKGVTIFVKKIVSSKPKGFKTMKIERISESKTVDYERAKALWESFELKNGGKEPK